MYVIKWKESIIQTFWKEENYGDNKKIHGCQGLGDREVAISRHSRECSGSENTLCDTVVMDVCHYTFVQTHKMDNAKSET